MSHMSTEILVTVMSVQYIYIIYCLHMHTKLIFRLIFCQLVKEIHNYKNVLLVFHYAKCKNRFILDMKVKKRLTGLE